MAATSAQASTIDLTGFTLSGNGGSVSANYGMIVGTTTLSGTVSHITSFDWNFTAADYLPYNDYSYFITTVFGTVNLASVSAVGDYGTTGWRTYHLGGAYSGPLTFGVTDLIDHSLQSKLEIRNLISDVPEPETYGMLLAGLALVGAIARRRARTA
ncbi:PEP-CTERM sorting domain-containing protein [Duganella sp. HSC-15S17]|nr:PEP-CTERM sorting domain-containing protein [Duganella violaceicalia]